MARYYALHHYGYSKALASKEEGERMMEDDPKWVLFVEHADGTTERVAAA
jgi:hypothetical protein